MGAIKINDNHSQSTIKTQAQKDAELMARKNRMIREFLAKRPELRVYIKNSF